MKNIVLCVLEVPQEIDTKEKLKKFLEEKGVEYRGIERWVYLVKEWTKVGGKP